MKNEQIIDTWTEAFLRDLERYNLFEYAVPKREVKPLTRLQVLRFRLLDYRDRLRDAYRVLRHGATLADD